MSVQVQCNCAAIFKERFFFHYHFFNYMRKTLLGVVMPILLRAALFLLAITPHSVSGTLVLPSTPPRGFNSFDLQVYHRKGVGPGWNESVYRTTAKALVSQGLLTRGYDTIVIDGGWSDHADKYGRSLPNEKRWPSRLEPQHVCT